MDPAASPPSAPGGTPRRLDIAFLATLETVAMAGRAAAAVAGLTCLGQAAVDEIELGLVEALTNVVEHGYGGEAGEVRLTVGLTAQTLWIELADRGRPMEPSLLADACLEYDCEDLDSLPESGMGLFLIQAAFDGVSYTSGGGWNRMVLVRNLMTL
ncbi:MAG TPA: ATP-binding protein [Azospirillaceae bacterium]|nr:ATP-binding protein [Azospirillaceae bacterium]